MEPLDIDTQVEHTNPKDTTRFSPPIRIAVKSNLGNPKQGVFCPLKLGNTFQKHTNLKVFKLSSANPAEVVKSNGLFLQVRFGVRALCQGEKSFMSMLHVEYPAALKLRLRVATPAKTSIASYDCRVDCRFSFNKLMPLKQN